MRLKKFFKSKKFRKIEYMCIFGTTLIILAAVINFTTNIIANLSNEASHVDFIEKDGTKYLSIKDGFIAEELKIEAGELLPTVSSYFDENYKLDEEVSIKYYDGDDTLEVSDFTYVKDDNIYVRGVMNLTALIKNDNEEYETKLVIKDTQKPVVILQPVELTEGEALDASRFVAIYVDNSQISSFNATIVGTADYSRVGNYDIQLNVCDSANNCVLGSTKLVVKKREVIKEEDISSFETGSGEEDGSGGNSGDQGGSSGNTGGGSGETKPAVADPSLTSLKVSKGTLSPTFKTSTKSYKVTVANSVSSLKITAKAASGSTFISGYGSRTVSLKVGQNTVYVKVKNSDNKTVAYKIVITRKKATSSSGGNTGDQGGSSGNTGGGTGGGSTGAGSSNETTERVFIGKKTSSDFPYKVKDHYGSKEYFLASSVTYNLYSDNYVEVLDYSGSIWTEWDFSGYKTDVKAMKAEAEDVLEANSSTREYFLKKTNETRAQNGVAPVALDYDLCVIATMRTFELTYGNTLTHNRPNGQRFYTILSEYGYKAGYYNGTKHYGENMAYWQYTDASAYTALINSSGHKQNILDSRWKKMGVGTFTFYGRKYWIQLFTT